MTSISTIVAVALSIGAAQQAPSKPAGAREAGTAVTLTGCVVAAVDREDSFQLVPAEPDPARPVGTSGTPAWVVPAYQLLGGIVSFAEHANKLVEVSGTLEPPAPPAVVDPKRGDTTQRTGAARDAVQAARLTVTAAKVVAQTCTPRKTGDKSK